MHIKNKEAFTDDEKKKSRIKRRKKKFVCPEEEEHEEGLTMLVVGADGDEEEGGVVVLCGRGKGSEVGQQKNNEVEGDNEGQKKRRARGLATFFTRSVKDEAIGRANKTRRFSARERSHWPENTIQGHTKEGREQKKGTILRTGTVGSGSGRSAS